jgi:hypothetical protein
MPGRKVAERLAIVAPTELFSDELVVLPGALFPSPTRSVATQCSAGPVQEPSSR